MKTLFAIVLGLALLAGSAQAAENPLATMAGIVAEMAHFPSDEQKATLAEIAGDEKVDPRLRTIAEAIGNVEHQPADADREKLQEILDDSTSNGAMKLLAGSVLRFEHQAAKEDAQALTALAQ